MMAGTIRGDVMVATKSPRGTKSRRRRLATAIPDKLGKASDGRITKDDVDCIGRTIATLKSPLRPRTKLGRQIQRRGELIRKLADAERAYTQFQFDTADANSSDNPKRMTADEWCDAVFEFEQLEYDLAAASNEFVDDEVEEWNVIASRRTMRASKPHGTVAQRIGKRIPMNSPNSNGWTSLGEASATLATPACSSFYKQGLRLLGVRRRPMGGIELLHPGRGDPDPHRNTADDDQAPVSRGLCMMRP